jgi:hypothetical protein
MGIDIIKHSNVGNVVVLKSGHLLLKNITKRASLAATLEIDSC